MSKSLKKVAEVTRGIVDLLLGADAVIPSDRVQANRLISFR